MKKHKYYLYGHGGSGNHGCEAIIRTTAGMLNERPFLFSFRPQEDINYGVDAVVDISKFSKDIKSNNRFLYYPLRLCKKVFKKSTKLDNLLNEYILKEGRNCRVALSVGGDNYCYGEPIWLMSINKGLNYMGKKTVLWGCSVEPELLRVQSVREDLCRYSLIVARESITYNALKEADISTKICLYPDPAFTLPVGICKLPESTNGYVGINFSSYVLKAAKDAELAQRSMEYTVEYFLNETGYNVVFIPHVVWYKKNDLDIMRPMYEKYRESGRVHIIDDCSCSDLKAAISQCRFFIGARTHSTIAAYSTMVPTLVIGYSVKANGIARDIFGSEEGYVLPAESINNKNDIIKAFSFIEKNEEKIHAHYSAMMPSYIKKAYGAAEEVMMLAGE